MANRYLTQFTNTMVKGCVVLFGKVAIGAAGAPTIDAPNSKGIKSITRVSAGLYDIVLGTSGANPAVDVYPRFLTMSAVVLNATAPAAPLFAIVSESVATPTTAKIRVQFANVAQVATDPASGEQLRLQIVLQNSTAQ